MNSCHKAEVDDDNKTVPYNIPNPETHKVTPKYNHCVWDGFYCRKSAGHRHYRDMLSGFGE